MILAEYDAEDTMRGYYEYGREEGWQQGKEAGWQQGKEAGWQQGKEAGRQQGRQEGYEAGKVDLIKRMLQSGIKPEIIAQSADIPLERILSYL